MRTTLRVSDIPPTILRAGFPERNGSGTMPAMTLSRTEFDALVETVIDRLPKEVRKLLEEVPVIVEDEPTDEQLDDVGIDPDCIDPDGDEIDLCGLHFGIPIGEKSIFSLPDVPSQIFIFRGPILRQSARSRKSIERQIEITLLHEIGHHFGFDHDKLRALGYD